MDSFIIEKLIESGYKYDSSVFPCYYIPLFSAIYRKQGGSTKETYLGKINNILAKSIPYKMDEKSPYHPNNGILWEIPVSTCPIFRFPIHSSFMFSFGTPGKFLTYTGISLMKLLKKPINYVLHLCDLMEIPKNKKLLKHKVFNSSLDKRKRTLFNVLSKINDDFRLMTTKDMISKIPGQ